jgi:hypothetical protein
MEHAGGTRVITPRVNRDVLQHEFSNKNFAKSQKEVNNQRENSKQMLSKA